MAATALTYEKKGPIDIDSRGDLYDKSMDLYIRRQDRTPMQMMKFFQQETTDVLQHKLTTWSTIFNNPRKLASDLDPINVEAPAPGYDNTITVNTYANSAVVTETMAKIDRSGMIGQIQNGLLESGRKFIEMLLANVINTGTATAGADGSYLFANDHYQEDPSAGTWSNIETGAALTSTTFATMRLNMRKQRNEKGLVMGNKLVKIVGPLDLEETLIKIAGSDKVPETGLNATNPWKGVNYEVLDYLTSTTAWFGIGDLPQAMNGLHYVVLTAPNVRRLAFPSSAYPLIKAGWMIHMQVNAGGSQLRNWRRNAGA